VTLNVLRERVAGGGRGPNYLDKDYRNEIRTRPKYASGATDPHLEFIPANPIRWAALPVSRFCVAFARFIALKS
jgi:hypothetical protein